MIDEKIEVKLPAGKRTETISTRVTEPEVRTYTQVAELHQMTVSDWLRSVAAKAAADYLR